MKKILTFAFEYKLQMFPIYKFELTVDSLIRRVHPIYGNDLAKEYELEGDQQFFREKLSGKLRFQKVDYDYINNAAFDTQFKLEIFISYDAGANWSSYWKGNFWKTDCEFNKDEKIVTVTPNTVDRYTNVLAGIDREYNLIDLTPEIEQVKADKRPMIQIYIPGQSVISCFMSGSWWEQECDTVEESETIEIGGDDVSKLVGYYYFNQIARERVIQTSGVSIVPDIFMGTAPANNSTPFTYQNGVYQFKFRTETGSGYITYFWEIVRVSDNEVMWSYANTSAYITPWDDDSYVLSPVPGTGASGDVTIHWRDIPVYARYICDVDTMNGVSLFNIPADDICATNPNYHFVYPYGRSGVIYFSALLSTEPTKWGLYSPGQYYERPSVYPNPELFPVSRAYWGRVSIWFAFYRYNYVDDVEGRKEFVIKHAHPIASAISVLLKQIAPEVTHEGTAEYSQFLYGGENLVGITQSLFITPKSNLVSAGYDQPAQKAPVTLKKITNMLRDCFRCFWFIDDNNRFRIEHIQFFIKGGSYSDQPVTGLDLTKTLVTRNGKPWSFASSKFTFDKPVMASRYQFGWMDDVTELFEGYPIEIISGYVNSENIEEITVDGFTSDVDYILLNPTGVSRDGFVLLAAVVQSIETEDVDINVAGITSCGSRINIEGEWASDNVATYYGGLVEVSKYWGCSYRIVSGNGGSYAFVKSGVVLNSNVDFATGWTGYELLPAGTTVTGTVPADARYLYVYLQSPGVSYRPQAITMLGVPQKKYKLPYVNHTVHIDEHILQNGYAAFLVLQQYYAYDMPAKNYSINGVSKVATGIKKLKKQKVSFPLLVDPDLLQLIRTDLGDGAVEKLSVNLSSRNANVTLKYDTE